MDLLAKPPGSSGGMDNLFLEFAGRLCSLGYMPLAVTVMIEHGLLRHQDRMRVTGTLAETASNNAGKGLDNLNHVLIRHYKDILRANLDALPATVAQRRRDGGNQGICSRGIPCQEP